ncbi:hypothetical protein [Hymenobacter actinosclerus]|uniref:Uncharacterized protein n=1 Tax=Hymenobacter actinosclerus TaxID=82805 RepID=A0A1I0GZJ9_9BACT|nr:hypothetical protein [Hymenobacter actinosclerus]SET76855.1 hypothetical protein SAMN04487998_2679 [Hymenobacter actinosclerus]
MLHRLTFAPFPDAAAATWFADLGDALEADGTTGLLLANLTVSEGQALAAVAVLPGRVVVLQPAAPAGTTAPKQQTTALATWLGTWPELPPVPAAAIAGFVIGADAAGTAWPATTLDALPRQLRELPQTLPLPAAALESWASSLIDDEEDPETYRTGFWEQKARQLWSWLGAADVPADPPYGVAPPAPAPATDTAAEQRRLEQLRQQLFAELEQQRLQMEAREEAREQSIAQLQQQLAATPTAAAEVAALQARLAAETQEKNALAAAITASRQEAEARNRELEARMQQLGRQVEQLQTRPATAGPAATVPAPTPGASPASAAPPMRQRPAGGTPARPRAAAPWRLQWPRVALVLGLLAGIGAGGWAVQHYAGSAARPAQAPARQDRPTDNEVDENLEAAAPTLFDIQPDTIRVEADKADSAAEIAPEPAVPEPGETMDSVTAPAEGI